MPIKYRIYKKKFKQNGEDVEKHFAVSVSNSLLDIRDLAKEIEQRSATKESMIVSTFIEISKLMAEKLSDGYNIKLDGIGVFGVAITSDGYDVAKDITPKQVRFSKMTFRPEKELVQTLKETRYYKEPPIPKGAVVRVKKTKTKKESEEGE